MTKRPVVVMDGFGGGLLLGIKAAGHKVEVDYEEGAYGRDVVEANFPKLNYQGLTSFGNLKKTGLAGRIVMSNVPCAWASLQNTTNGAHKRGTEAAKFQPTKAVLAYALGHGADALAVESVCNALELGRKVHDAAAKRYGYDLFRVLQNAATFGLPQWRERCWVLFVRRGLLRDGLRAAPLVWWPTALGDVLEHVPTDADPRLISAYARQTKLLPRSAKRALLGADGYGALGAILKRKLGGDLVAVNKRYVVWGSFQSQTPRVLDLEAPTPTLLHHSFFIAGGRPLSYVELNRVSGFPDNYVFPNLRRQREFLSRGVCPPVAAWVLKTLQANLDGTAKGQAYAPGSTIDLRLKRSEWARLRTSC